ncbi:ATP-binding cassette domain-containing protein [Microbacterium sp. SYP-A9085]|uniref:ABC transporter ATP-binding protein n=1 Tax=Microbacterium sp. SYP-A9085 TaxID=2664454 RepID=UPI00129A136E|nr:ABC transporter ATP-binding protein [Microbacterium sp. SYP-A9085]MRH27776.1 ATP-binding cassette domain-containing protein [Microbacterium sp. SYP-A9085]
MSKNPDILKVSSLRKVYGSGSAAVHAIGDLSFRVKSGELVCIVGPSGAGKTTFLRCVAGLLTATSGDIELDGVAIDGPPKDMAVVFQEYGRSLYPWMTVAQNVEFPLLEKKLGRSRRSALVSEALEAVGLASSAAAYPWQLSGGMQQRVAIARAIAYEPRLLIMDEPFAAVDAQTRADLEDLVRDLWSRFDITVLFVTHDIDESVYLAQRVLVLSSAPTFMLAEVEIDLPDVRDQLTTRSDPRFTAHRTRIYQLIQEAKHTNWTNRADCSPADEHVTVPAP